jgi:hypothetical protein
MQRSVIREPPGLRLRLYPGYVPEPHPFKNSTGILTVPQRHFRTAEPEPNYIVPLSANTYFTV